MAACFPLSSWHNLCGMVTLKRGDFHLYDGGLCGTAQFLGCADFLHLAILRHAAHGNVNEYNFVFDGIGKIARILFAP